MDRRGFLKGVFGGVAAGGAVLLASPEDIEKFARNVPEGSEMISSQLEMPDYERASVAIGDMVFDSQGRPFGIVQGYDANVEMLDISSHSDLWARVLPGPRSIIATVNVSGVISTRVR